MVDAKAALQIDIDLSEQRLCLKRDDEVLFECDVSSAANGAGEVEDSQCTPRGLHEICEKIGDGCPVNTVFIGRRPTGEIYSAKLGEEGPGRDWILTRILWLSGLEPGHNQGGNCDSKQRYIYLHGTPDTTPMRTLGSHGCVRLKNEDVLHLFDAVEVGTRVFIHE